MFQDFLLPAQPAVMLHHQAAGERILAALERPVRVGQDTVDVCASIGVATSRGFARSADQLIQAADRALYAAKRDGGDRCALAE